MSFSRLQTIFTGAGDIALRDARAELDVIEGERQPAAEAAAEQQVGELHLFDVDAERVGRGGARIERILHAGPDLGADRRRPAPCTPSAPSSRGRGTAPGSRR